MNPRRPMLLSAALAAAFLATLCVRPPVVRATPDDDAWWQVSTPEATVVGDADPWHIREIAAGLGRFRTVLGSVHPGALLRPAAPVVVVVFRDRASGVAYSPLYEGRPVEVGGTYLPGTDQHLLTVSTDKPASDWQALFHEYTHLVIQQTLRQVPPWFDEGLAEFHATVVFGGNGRRAEVGRAHEAHLRLLRREPMLPVLELLATTRDDALYNEGDRRGMFYAQSWLLVHYLLGGDGSRATSAFGYLDEIQRGATVEQALDRALRTTPALLEKDLGDYLQRSPFTARVVALPSSASQPGAAATPLSLADANAWRGELLLRLDRRHEARQRLEQALGLDGQHPRALAALGRLAAVEQQFSEARNTLARAAALAPHDPVIQVRFARAALDQARLGDRTAGGLPEDVRVAEVAARRALAALPTMAEAHAVLATAALARRDADVATAETRRAIDLAPARDDLRLLLAHAHLAANRRAEALALLRDLVERAQPPRLRADAARLLEQTESAIRDKAAGPGRQPRH